MLLAIGVVNGCGTSEDLSTTPGTASASSTTAMTTSQGGDGPPEFPAVPLADIGLSIPAACPTPWLPAYAQDEQFYPVSVPPTEVRPAGGTPIDLVERRYQPPDTDGDGTPDEQLEGVDEGRSFALRRSSGDLVLATDGAVVGAPGGASWVGDLNGDGRDEVLVFVADSSAETDYPLYVVPGSAPAGRHDPRVVGARLPASAGMPAESIGDVDGDGSGDLLLPGSDETLVVISGVVVMNAVGGELDQDVAPLASLPVDVRSTLLLGKGRSVPVRVTPAKGDQAATELMLLTDPPVVLRTERVPLSVDAARTATITGFENEAGRYVQLEMYMSRSGTRIVFVWNLDEPCAGPTTTG